MSFKQNLKKTLKIEAVGGWSIHKKKALLWTLIRNRPTTSKMGIIFNFKNNAVNIIVIKNHNWWQFFPALIKINLCQKLSFLNLLTHNMTRDCSLNFKTKKKTIFVHNFFWACNFREIQWTISCHCIVSLQIQIMQFLQSIL